MPNPVILVVEDEAALRKFLNTLLTSHEYQPAFAETVAEGLKRMTLHPPELVLLDLGLPDEDGLVFIRKVREWSQVPIIVLSAQGLEERKIEALEEGADDYLTKPFGSGELLARMKAALRRSGDNGNAPAAFEANGLRFDLEKRQVSVDGAEIHLTPIEYKLLAALVKHAGKVVTHTQLLKEVWGKSSTENNHYLRIYTQHLRQKLGDSALKPRYILTEPGVGYRLKIH